MFHVIDVIHLFAFPRNMKRLTDSKNNGGHETR